MTDNFASLGKLQREKLIRSMTSFIGEHWREHRSPNSPGSENVIAALASRLQGRIIESASGSECLTWLMPDRWEVKEAYLLGPEGQTIVDIKDDPLCLWWHSVAVDKSLSLEDLESHIYSLPEHPDCLPFHYRHGYQFDAREWGFSLLHSLRSTLPEGKYRVFIDSTLEQSGHVKTLDYHLPGAQEECVFFAAHNCHSAQVTDGLSNVAVLAELFDLLGQRKERRWSYRLIIGPEYYAGASFLANTPSEEIENLAGGYYLDMMGNSQPLAMQRSFQGNTVVDKAARNVLRSKEADYKEFAYRKLWGNDEMFYEGSGFWIPTPGIAGLPHTGYHTSNDSMENLDVEGLADGLETMLRIVQILEEDVIIKPLFKGPIYLSRFDLYIDPKVDVKGYENIEAIQILMNGLRSCLDIADNLQVDYFFVRNFVDALEQRGLVSLIPNDGMFNSEKLTNRNEDVDD